MTTLREAALEHVEVLEQLVPLLHEYGIKTTAKDIEESLEALRAALAQPEQEPTRSQKMRDAGITRRPKGWDKEQELEGINEVILNSIRDSSEVVAPPQREWQGLTPEDKRIAGIPLYTDQISMSDAFDVIERILKEKNCAPDK